MKNAMKKLMSLVLVAVLLVSAVPFAASAATGDPITFKVKYSDEKVSDPIVRVPSNQESATIAAILTNWGKMDAGEFLHAAVSTDGNSWTTVNDINAEIKAGEYVTVAVKSAFEKPIEITDPNAGKEDTSNKDEGTSDSTTNVNQFIKFQIRFGDSDEVTYTKIAQPENGKSATISNLLVYWYDSDWYNDYTFSHAYSSNDKKTINDANTTVYVGDTITIRLLPKNTTGSGSTGSSSTGSSSGNGNKFKWDIYLNIYVNNKVDAPAKTIKINDTIALDGTVSLSETLTIVDDYYNATDSTKGIILDGLYQGKGNWALNFVTDSGKYNSFTNLDAAREENYVFINVMATNVTAKTTATADSSNPKTGDMVFMPIVVLGLSASALAVMFYLNKKRAV